MYRYQSHLEEYEATLCDRCGAECTGESIEITVGSFLDFSEGDFCRACSLALTGLTPRPTALPSPDPAGANAEPDHLALHLIDLMRDIDEMAGMVNNIRHDIDLEWRRSLESR